MICERCGRLLNRATGQCAVCADHGGEAPPPVATREAAAGPDDPSVGAPPPAGLGATGVARPGAEKRATGRQLRGPSRDPGEAPHLGRTESVAATLRPASAYRLAPPLTPSSPPSPSLAPEPPVAPPAPAASAPIAPTVAPPVAPPPPPEDDQPISVSAAVAILDLSDRPERPARATPASPSAEPPPPPPPPRTPGAPVGVLRGGRLRRRKVDLVAYDGNLVVAKRGASQNLTSGQLAAQDPSSRILAADAVAEALVREDAVSGQVRIKLRAGDDVVVRWPGWKNRGVSAENLFAHSFPGKVDQGSPEIAKRTVRVMVTFGVAILVAVAAFLGLSALLEGDPPPPPPPAPPTTLPTAEQAARTALQQACPAWQQFAGTVAPGDRPDPAAVRPVVDGMRPWFVAAADAGADPIYTTARDEVGYLQDYARRPVEDVARESVSRVGFAIQTITSACDRAAGGS